MIDGGGVPGLLYTTAEQHSPRSRIGSFAGLDMPRSSWIFVFAFDVGFARVS